jgi:hypothetical protein
MTDSLGIPFSRVTPFQVVVLTYLPLAIHPQLKSRVEGGVLLKSQCDCS